MIFLRTIATVAVVGITFSSTVNAALATELIAQSDKVTICQRTGSAKNPYVEITISRNALPAHEKKGDFLATPGCQPPAGTPQPPDSSPQPPNPSNASVDCVITGDATQTANTVTGTSGDDTIDCTNASPGKTITGGDGNDTITGTAFNDAIDAGNGNDTVTGGPGDDIIEGGNGNDTLTGSGGNNTVTDIGDGEDTITP